ncbi:MAG: head GIN domain-containing protein [Mucilaginibacter sp.]|uniref:head GIN domain-containing protein n=1 Tax=Mucilaginibacter sp. TaxID=1882438 RepID=UPI003267F952
MKKIYMFLAVAVSSYALIGLSACNVACTNGSGKMVTETRKVTGFDKIDISGGFDVVIKQDTAESLSITADDNLMEAIKSEVSDGNLKVKTKGSICNSGKLVLNISLRDLSKIETSGAVNVTSNGKITTKKLVIGTSGAAKITLDLSADNLFTNGSGSTELNLTGQASSHLVNFSGSGTLNALDFVVAKYTIESSGATHCKINVLNELNVSSSGVSDVEYRGNPAKIHEDKSGALTLKKID